MNVSGGKYMQITKIPAKPKEYKTLRVAAYARVSADKDAAFHSLEAQTEYYEKYVSNHDGSIVTPSPKKEDGICTGLLIMKWYSLLIISEKKLTNLATQ